MIRPACPPRRLVQTARRSDRFGRPTRARGADGTAKERRRHDQPCTDSPHIPIKPIVCERIANSRRRHPAVVASSDADRQPAAVVRISSEQPERAATIYRSAD
jgi:hypothetical protein